MTILEVKNTDSDGYLVDPEIQRWEWFVGDPCYMLNTERYSRMQTVLFPQDGERRFPTSFNIEGERIEVHSSPGGDGCWKFNEPIEDCIAGKEIGVDSGLIAVLPRALCSRLGLDKFHESQGLFFTHRPDLEPPNDRSGWFGGYKSPPVLVNTTACAGYDKCEDCREYSDSDYLDECTECSRFLCQNCWCGCEDDE